MGINYKNLFVYSLKLFNIVARRCVVTTVAITKTTDLGGKTSVRAHIRWMIRLDMPEVLQIERESFEFSWLEDDFIHHLRQRDTIGMVAEVDNRVAGFMIYTLYKSKIHVLNFAVAPDLRRLDIGSQMVDKLIAKLSLQRRSSIMLEVRETNLGAQLFFRKKGFEYIFTIRNHYRDSPEDAYQMRYIYKPNEQQTKNHEGITIAQIAR